MLILILSFFLWLVPQKTESDFIILILDDCEAWEYRELPFTPNEDHPDKVSRFWFDKNWSGDATGFDRYVWLSHLWNFLINTRGDEGRGKSIVSLTYSQILNLQPLYSSNILFQDWYKIHRKYHDKIIYVMLPSDYCSEKRFVHDYKFTLYQVNITLPYTE